MIDTESEMALIRAALNGKPVSTSEKLEILQREVLDRLPGAFDRAKNDGKARGMIYAIEFAAGVVKRLAAKSPEMDESQTLASAGACTALAELCKVLIAEVDKLIPQTGKAA